MDHSTVNVRYLVDDVEAAIAFYTEHLGFELLTSAALRTLAARLVELHGQHEHQALLDPSTHLPMLDSYAGLDAPVAEVAAAWNALQEAREHLVGALERPRSATAAGHLEVLPHAERRKDAPALRDERHPEIGHPERRPPRDVLLLEAHGAAPRRREADDGADQGGLAHAVPAEDGHHLAGSDAERHAVEHVALAVVGVDVGDLKHRDRSPARADRP